MTLSVPATEVTAVPFCLPDISDEDVAAVAAVVRSGRLSIGPQLEAFERAMAERVGVDHAVGVSSGTAGLHAILMALGVGPGDEVLVPSFTFSASVSVIFLTGATPVFVDIEPTTYNLDVADCAAKISPRTKAILAVDVFGVPADWPALTDLAGRHGLQLIDDCCEALGASIGGRALGAWGDAGCFGFYPNKQITTGEGGMVTTNDAALAARLRSIRNQGRAAMGQWLEHESLGVNYRMDEMSAALGVSQLSRLPDLLERRATVAQMYTERLGRLSAVRTPSAPLADPSVRRSWFVYVIELPAAVSRDGVMKEMERLGVPTRAYFSPIHCQPYVQERCAGSPRLAATAARGALPVTEAVAARTLALPFYPGLTADQIERVAVTLEAVLGDAAPS